MKRNKRLLLPLFYLVICFTCGALEEQAVLFISSYHPAFPSFSQQVEGIQSVLGREDFVFDWEFMDAKRFLLHQAEDLLFHQLSFKLSCLPRYDVIIVGDDNALRFALNHRAELFPRTPLVFLGVNDIDLARDMETDPLVTGVVEAVSLEETVEMAWRLFPRVERVVALVDGTASGQGDLATFYKVAPRFPHLRFEELSLESLSWQEFGAALSGLGPETVVLLLSAYIDQEEEVLSFSESLALIKNHYQGALFHLWYHGMGDGVLGGKLISHYEQGRTAGSLALRILQGEPVSQISVVTESPNAFVFDYNELVRLEVPSLRYPPGADIINRPASFYRDNWILIWAVAGVISLLTVALGASLFNIRRRRRVEAELRSKEEHLRVTLDSIADGVIVTNLKGQVVRLNPVAEKLTGWSSREAAGVSLDQIYMLQDSDIRGSLPEPLLPGRAEEAKPEPPGVRQLLRRDGGSCLVSDSIAPILTDRGTALGSVLVFRDVTAERAIQEELQHHHKIDALGQLASGVAHDFNNILTGIIAAGQLLKAANHPLDEQGLRCVDVILQASGRAADLNKKILAFARKGDSQKVLVDVHALLDEVTAILSRALPKTTRIRVIKGAHDPKVMGDESALHNMLINLGINGSHAMPRGGEIVFETRRVFLGQEDCQFSSFDLQPGEFCEVMISDGGCGIPAEHLNKIFEPFYTTKPQGTGLGLSAVHGIVKDHGGSISVNSEIGRGTSFRILLPIPW